MLKKKKKFLMIIIKQHKHLTSQFGYASIAQLVERLTVNQQAGGSSPPRGDYYLVDRFDVFFKR